MTDAEFEADFFLDPVHSRKRQKHWKGLVVERQCNGILAMENVRMPPPTVNDLATLLFLAMHRPPDYEQRQRPCTIYLRDRPQWQVLLPHPRQLEIDVVLTSDLPWFDESVMDWVTRKTNPPSQSEWRAILRQPFPERKRSWFTDAMNLMEWSDGMFKKAYPSREVAVPAYDPTTVVSIRVTAKELETILTQTDIAKTKKLRPRLEAITRRHHTWRGN